MIINNKQFTQIDTHKLYFISADGEVYTTIKKKLLKPALNRTGYKQVWLIDNDAQARWERLHTLVALTFVPNPNEYKEVNHIDGDKNNNHYSNLHWCTRQQNMRHAHDIGLMKNRGRNKGYKHSDQVKELMSIKKLGKRHPKYNGDYITPKGRFVTANQAAIANNVSAKSIHLRCKDRTWEYLGWTKSNTIQSKQKPMPKNTLQHITLVSGKTIKL